MLVWATNLLVDNPILILELVLLFLYKLEKLLLGFKRVICPSFHNCISNFTSSFSYQNKKDYRFCVIIDVDTRRRSRMISKGSMVLLCRRLALLSWTWGKDYIGPVPVKSPHNILAEYLLFQASCMLSLNPDPGQLVSSDQHIWHILRSALCDSKQKKYQLLLHLVHWEPQNQIHPPSLRSNSLALLDGQIY